MCSNKWGKKILTIIKNKMEKSNVLINGTFTQLCLINLFINFIFNEMILKADTHIKLIK
jgi:hypothetical protein